MAAVLGVLCAMAVVWSAVRYQFAYRSVIDSLPPQFQDNLNSRYAFPVYALEPSTPLPAQAEYMKALWGGCVASLCASLCFFSLGNFVVGTLVALGFFLIVFSTLKSKKAFDANRRRQEAGNDGGD